MRASEDARAYPVQIGSHLIQTLEPKSYGPHVGAPAPRRTHTRRTACRGTRTQADTHPAHSDAHGHRHPDRHTPRTRAKTRAPATLADTHLVCAVSHQLTSPKAQERAQPWCRRSHTSTRAALARTPPCGHLLNIQLLTDGCVTSDHVRLNAKLPHVRKELQRIARPLGLLISTEGIAAQDNFRRQAPPLQPRQEVMAH